MNRSIKKLLSVALSAAVLAASLSGCGGSSQQSGQQAQTGAEKTYYPNETALMLSDSSITANGEQVGTEGAVYLSNDVIYYEDKDNYESGNPYGEGTAADKHTADEAAAVTVVNITQPGYYRLSGRLSNGQIRVDLGEDAFEDENAVVTLVMDGIDITCDVAPAVIFMNVYECDNQWSVETATSTVDTTKAGANVIVADGSTNNVNGAYVAKIFKDKEGEKKLCKQDGAFYYYMSMNIDGEANNTGVLNIKAKNEGLDTELHLTINGANINIYADNDGINTNEDGVSVTTINGGNIHIIAGLGVEGDGVDSNGWLVINGGTVISAANPGADAGLDSDMGSYVNGGTVVALGSTMDWAESDSKQVTMNLQFADYKESDSAIVVAKQDGSVIFAYDPSEDEVVGSNTRKFRGAILSCADFAMEETYNVYIGGTIKGSETAGIYDVSTITEVNSVQQAYTGSDIMMRPGGMGGFGGDFKGQRPGMPQGDGKFDFNGQIPEGFDFNGGNMPQNFEGKDNFNGQLPQNFEGMEDFDFENFDFNGQRPQGDMQFDPNNMPMPGGNPQQWGQNGNDKQQLPANTDFYMQDKVNNFSGVTDYIA